MSIPPTQAQLVRQAAEVTGRYALRPGGEDKLPLTGNDIERVTADFLCSERGVEEAEARVIAQGLRGYVTDLFCFWFTYDRGEVALDAAPRPDALEGEERERTLRSFARALYGKGLKVDEVTACLLVLNDSRCMPPLSDREVAAIALRSQHPRAA